MKNVFNRIKVIFSPTNNQFDRPIEDYIIGVLQKVLGSNNKWHDNFSSYNVSTLLGGVIENNTVTFPNGGYFYVSSPEKEFIGDFVKGLFENGESIYLRDMHYEKFELLSDAVHSDYDIIKTISPILLKHKDKIFTFKDKEFIDILTSQCIGKLLHMGISGEKLRNFEIIPFHFENAKIKYSKRKKYALPSSKIMLIVKGNSECRKLLYEIGIGNSTGYCYGAVEIVNKHLNNLI